MFEITLEMAFSRDSRSWVVLLFAFIGSCATLPAIEDKEEAARPKPERSSLAIYFDPPELPERFYNPEKPKKKKTKRKAVAKTKDVYKPLLPNPVIGASRNSIISFYGDARDGGKRRHEGIDIFAPKGTVIVAPSDGLITSVGYNVLGGKVIWMDDSKRKHSYYFAHLDSQIVRQGVMVKQGDTLGTVGNTGNARRTRSHLHFGIYHKGSKNPVSYIRSRDQLISVSAVSTTGE